MAFHLPWNGTCDQCDIYNIRLKDHVLREKEKKKSVKQEKKPT